MKRCVFFASLILTVGLVLVFSGCSKPHEAAMAAMEKSRAAGAERYAPADFAVAQKLLGDAETKVKDGKDQEAKQGFSDAGIAFEKATASAEAGKKAMIPEAAASVAALEEGWKNLEAIISKEGPRMRRRKIWQANLKNFQEGLKAAKEMVNSDPAAAKAKALQLKDFIEDYNDYFQNLAPKTRNSSGTAD
ncbi:MAG: hypothetical protein ACYC6Q_09300 [Syntrophales bacterium]